MPGLKEFQDKAQTMLEYLLVLVVISTVVFGAFVQKGGVLARTQNRAAEYFNTGSAAILGGYYDGNTYVANNPVPIDGGWCGWTDCVTGFKQRECACPRPAFGGAACDGDAVWRCH